jgi:polysaccharide biosynthesis protein PslG
VTVVAGEIAYSDGDFLEELYDRGRIQGSYDALSYHPYTDGRDPAAGPGRRGLLTSFIDGSADMRAIMNGVGDRAPLWMTEVGASTCTGSTFCVSEATQADQIRSFITLSRDWADVPVVIVYSLVDTPGPPTQMSSRFGLLRTDLQPKPAWEAYREAIAP